MRICDLCGQGYSVEYSYQTGKNIFIGHKSCMNHIERIATDKQEGNGDDLRVREEHAADQ